MLFLNPFSATITVDKQEAIGKVSPKRCPVGNSPCWTLPIDRVEKDWAVSIIGFAKILSGRQLSGRIPTRKGR